MKSSKEGLLPPKFYLCLFGISFSSQSCSKCKNCKTKTKMHTTPRTKHQCSIRQEVAQASIPRRRRRRRSNIILAAGTGTDRAHISCTAGRTQLRMSTTIIAITAPGIIDINDTADLCAPLGIWQKCQRCGEYLADRRHPFPADREGLRIHKDQRTYERDAIIHKKCNAHECVRRPFWFRAVIWFRIPTW